MCEVYIVIHLFIHRWGHTPASDAEEFGHPEVAEYINEYEKKLEEEAAKDVIEEAEEEGQVEQ